jgi:hypothetical protein
LSCVPFYVPTLGQRFLTIQRPAPPINRLEPSRRVYIRSEQRRFRLLATGITAFGESGWGDSGSAVDMCSEKRVSNATVPSWSAIGKARDAYSISASIVDDLQSLQEMCVQ